MSGMPPVQAGVSRRSCLALALTALAGCGGGGGGASASLPGTGGTGIYAQGSIAGFGSVIVNAVRYDDTRASVSIDGHTIGTEMSRKICQMLAPSSMAASSMSGRIALK